MAMMQPLRMLVSGRGPPPASWRIPHRNRSCIAPINAAHTERAGAVHHFLVLWEVAGVTDRFRRDPFVRGMADLSPALALRRVEMPAVLGCSRLYPAAICVALFGGG